MEHLTEIKALSKDLLKIYIELGKVTLELARKQEGANSTKSRETNALFMMASQEIKISIVKLFYDTQKYPYNLWKKTSL